MSDIEWEDPPQIKHRSVRTKADLRRAMRENPGRWLVWSRSSTRANASNIRFRHPELEVEWAYLDDLDTEKVTIYTRIPPVDNDDE